MKNVHIAILAACIGALGSLKVQAQNPNTAFGTGALSVTQPNLNNSAFGYGALYYNSTGISNTAVGMNSLFNNTTGYSNTAVGVQALINNTVGYSNTAIGDGALYGNLTGIGNTALGNGALVNSTGGSNIGIGLNAGEFITSTSDNIDIGNHGVSTDTGTIRIGAMNDQTSFYVAGVSGVQISGAVPVYINSDGQLGTINSSIRFKEDVHDMADASSKLFLLRPVTYRYKQAYEDGSKPVDYGLIAEEVAQVYPDMVTRDAGGEIQTVQYQKLTPMLLNEVQKQHRQLRAQQDTIHTLEQRLSALETAVGASHVQDSARVQSLERTTDQ